MAGPLFKNARFMSYRKELKDISIRYEQLLAEKMELIMKREKILEKLNKNQNDLTAIHQELIRVDGLRNEIFITKK